MAALPLTRHDFHGEWNTPSNPNNVHVIYAQILTIETLSFHDKLGKVPNRGLLQADIELNGVPYLQSISDVTDPTITTPIHLEPGLWLIVPPTEHPDARESTFARLASIPHGTTINAQGTMVTIAGPPQIEPVDITPFSITDPTVLHTFASQTVSDVTTARIPQDLSIAPAITQELLNDPNLLLRQHIDGMTILSTDEITIDTDPTVVPGGGTGNIGFLVGFFWPQRHRGEDVGDLLDRDRAGADRVGPLKAGDTAKVSPAVPLGAPAPTFAVTSTYGMRRRTANGHGDLPPDPAHPQNVSLNFATLTWPHASVATLVPDKVIAVEL